MALGIASLLIIFMGVVLIGAGLFVSLSDWRRKNNTETKEVTTEPLSAEKTLNALTRFTEALKGLPLGMQLIIVGLAVLIIGVSIGGVGELGSQVKDLR